MNLMKFVFNKNLCFDANIAQTAHKQCCEQTENSKNDGKILNILYTLHERGRLRRICEFE